MPLVISGGGRHTVSCDCGQFTATTDEVATGINRLLEHDELEHPRKRAPTSEASARAPAPTSEADALQEGVGRCPVCADPIDYCQGHGKVADYEGWRRLQSHDLDIHYLCHPQGCDEAPRGE